MTATAPVETESDFGQLVRTEFPNGTEVFYRDSDHSYWAEAKPNPKAAGGWSGSGRLTGVSTLCAPYDFRPDPLMRWVDRLGCEGFARAFGWHDGRPSRPVPTDPYALRGVLKNLGLTWEQIRDEAATRGTDVHALMLHALARGEEIPSLSSLPEDQQGYGQAVLRWWRDRRPKVTHAEQVVASTQHGFAGTLDLRCEINDPLRPGPGIVDAKTSSFISGKMFAQPAGYDLGVVESGLDEPAEWLMILKLEESGEYREIWVDATHEDFLAALRIYRRSAEWAKAAKAAV